MIARKASSRTRRKNLGVLIEALKENSEYLEAARTGIGRNYYCRDLDRLSVGIAELNRIIFELEKSAGGAS